MRHGQSADNLAGLISGGASDPDLTEEGKAQAAAAALIYQSLKNRPSKIISSRLKRALQTARILSGGNDVFEDKDLNERHLGELDGLITEAEQKLKKILPGEECSTLHKARVLRAVNKHLETDDIPIFVCHGGTIRRIIEALEIKNTASIMNARIYHFRFQNGEWNMKEIN